MDRKLMAIGAFAQVVAAFIIVYFFVKGAVK